MADLEAWMLQEEGERCSSPRGSGLSQRQDMFPNYILNEKPPLCSYDIYFSD